MAESPNITVSVQRLTYLIYFDSNMSAFNSINCNWYLPNIMCLLCTLENDCHICEAKRAEFFATHNYGMLRWQCTECSFFNINPRFRLTNCEVCYSKPPNITTTNHHQIDVKKECFEDKSDSNQQIKLSVK